MLLDFGDCQHPRDIASQHTSTHGRGAARAAGQARDPDGIDDGGRAHEPARGFPRQQFRLVVWGQPRGRSDGHLLAQSRRPGAAGGAAVRGGQGVRGAGGAGQRVEEVIGRPVAVAGRVPAPRVRPDGRPGARQVSLGNLRWRGGRGRGRRGGRFVVAVARGS